MVNAPVIPSLIYHCLAEFSRRTSKPQPKKQKVAKKKKGEDQDPYDFDSGDETQESGGKTALTQGGIYFQENILYSVCDME